YAEALHAALQKRGNTCFLDSSEYRIGDPWDTAGKLALSRTRVVILVGTKGALSSAPVLQEVRYFVKELRRPVFPIDIGDALATAPASPLNELLGGPTSLRAREDESRRGVGPSRETVDSISRSFRLLRQSTKRTRVVACVAAVFGVVAALAGVL